MAGRIKRRQGVGENDVVLAPVRANEGTRIWYERKLQELLRCMHDSMKLHIAAAWKAEPPSIGFAADDANSSTVIRRALSRWGRLWQSKFDSLSSELARKFAEKAFGTTQSAMAASLAGAGFTVKFRPSPESLEAYQAVVAQNVALIKSVPQIFLKDIANSVWSSVTAGGDLATLSKSLQQNYGVSYKRAALIARTENFKAKAVIESVRRKQLGIDTAIWMHSSAGKIPRPAHVAMNGQKFDISKGMFDADEGKYVFPGQLINCRCTSRAIIEGMGEE